MRIAFYQIGLGFASTESTQHGINTLNASARYGPVDGMKASLTRRATLVKVWLVRVLLPR